MLTALQQFKDDYDRNQPLARILPEFCQQHRRYERMGLRDLCQHVHQLYAKYDIARLTTEMYLSDLQPAMKPTDAYAHIAQRKTERVEIDHLEGRITVGLVTPYPPGIPLLIPGEVFNRKIVDYLLFAREFAKECPGFETDIHGLVELQSEDGEVRYYADCVAGTAPARKTPAGGKPAAKKAVKTAAKPAAKTAAKTVAKTVAKAAAKPAAKPAAKVAKAAAVTGVKAPAKRPAARKAQPAAPEVGTAAKPARGRKMVQVGDDGPFGRTI